jgi:CRISPR-associated protein Cas1
MTSLYVDRRGVEMRLDGAAIAFYESGGRIGTVPSARLERVYLRGDVTLTSGLLGRLGQMGIGVIVLSGRRAEPSLFLPRPHNDASLRVAQTRLHLDAAASVEIARWLVRGKIRAQIALGEEWRETVKSNRAPLNHVREALCGMLPQVAAKGSVDALRGLEGAAAAQHFKALAAVLPDSLRFAGRNRRPPRDPG